MPADLYADFLASGDTLRIYRAGELVYSSQKDRLLPLLDYLTESSPEGGPVEIYDAVTGNAAACLAVLANARHVCSPMGSELAIQTLKEHGITWRFDEVVPFIRRDDGVRMCPMEELSLDKTPEEFYAALKARISAGA